MKQPIQQLILTMGLAVIATAATAVLMPGAYAQPAAVTSLLERARTQEQSGHIDLAAQSWQQVLLSDPKNTEALAGLARWAKLAGNSAESERYLQMLRQVSPNDPNIGRVQGMVSSKAQDAQLVQASRLAQSGHPEDALKIYRQTWGDHPPDGDWAVAYYTTEAATDAGREHAIAGLRALMQKYPSDTRYGVNLGRILTYHPPTRPEGERILRQYPQDAGAQAALRQALLWDSQNPNAAPAIRDYLKTHKDEALSNALTETQARQASANRGMAQGPAEEAAFRALGAKKVDEAQRLFLAINARQPDNPRVLAGLGFVRMQQGNFAGAITYLEQAQQNGMRDKAVAEALVTSRFWNSVQEGTTALNDNRLDEAEAKYRAALEIRPKAPEPLEGLSGAYLKGGQPEKAVPIYEQLVKAQPNSATGWRGLFTAQVQAGQPAAAIDTVQRFPASVRSALSKDPEYLQNLSAAYTATGQTQDAQKVLAQALVLPFPDNGRNMKAETRMQYAGLLAADKRYAQAAGLYRDIVMDDPTNVGAWQGLVSIQHIAAHDADAVATVERMPPETYEAALQDMGFLSTLSAIYQSQNHLDVAQGFLQRAAQVAADKGQPVPVSLQLQLAAMDLQRNNPQQAYAIYRGLLTEHPDRVDAWKGLMTALHSTGHDQDALAQIQQIPPDVRRVLDQDVDYQQTIAAIDAATGNPQDALRMLNQIQAHYRARRLVPPADVDVQSAWLLFNAGADRDLYRALMALGGRSDLTDDQRRQVQTIWASWSVRRAGQAATAGNSKRAMDILNAASLAFPGNPDVTKALAGGYLKAGDPKQALAIYRAMEASNGGVSNPSSGDYQGMVSAALAAPDMKQAETWLRKALASYPNDPQVLTLAARFEQARGDNTRAAAYWKASLAAMPSVSPENRLAHTLDKVDLVQQSRNGQDANLASLLNPDAEAPTRQAVPALPSYQNTYSASASASTPLYGPDPYSVGNAPVQLNGGRVDPLPMSDNRSGNNNQTVVTTTTTTTYARPATKSTVAHRAGAECANPPCSAMAKSSVAVPAPTTAVRRRASRSDGSNTQTITTSRTVTSSGDGSSSSTERLGDYSPEGMPRSSVQAPAMPAANPAAENAGTFAPPSLAGVHDGQGRDGTRSESAASAGGIRAADGNEQVHTLDSAELHLQISASTPSEGAYGDSLAPKPEPAEAPLQLTLDASPAIRYVPNSSPSLDAYNRASSTLASAEKPVDAAYLEPMQTSTQQEVSTQPYSPSPQYVQQPPLSDQSQQSQIQTQQQPPPGWKPVKQTVVTTTATTTAAVQQQGMTDDQLQQQNLPPLRGPYGKPHTIRVRDPREEAEMQLATIEGGYSPWMGGSGYVNHRSGTVGFDKLTMLEAPFEATTPFGGSTRLSIVTMPSFLDSGIADGTSTNRLGTLPVGATPTQQNAAGVGGELQFSTSTLGASVGYTPYGFLVSNVIGRFNWRPATGPFTFSFTRDAVKDSQLSYSGLRDPGSAGPGFDGNIWGGVVANSVNARFGKGDAKSGYYVGAGGQYITGYHVPTNNRIDGTAGAYWGVLNIPDTGSLTVGANFFGMHYAHNLRFFTYGQGGYFSPDAYLLASVPLTWNGRYGVNLHYTVTGALGIQAFQEDTSPFFPLDAALQVANKNPSYPSQSNVGSNYDLHAEAAYHVTDHWYVGGFVSANNTRDYASQVAGFFIRFMIRPQYPTEAGPTGLFPYQGLRPLMVP